MTRRWLAAGMLSAASIGIAAAVLAPSSAAALASTSTHAATVSVRAAGNGTADGTSGSTSGTTTNGNTKHKVSGKDAAPATGTTSASSAASAANQTVTSAAGDLLGCKSAPVPEMPGRGVVGFFESTPKTLPPDGDPFAPNSTTSIYEQYGYAGLTFNTYDLGCGSDLVRSPDAAVGTAVANWIMTVPKAAVAATGAVLGTAYQPDFLGVFDPLISRVVEALRHAVFEQWAFVVIAALGLLLIWRSRQASLASSASAIGWALLVMVLATMVFRWPLVAGHAADKTVTTTLGAVTGSLNDKVAGSQSNAGNEATAGMENALLYQSWLGGTFGSTNSKVAEHYGPIIFDASALTWRQAQILQTDPAQGAKIIQAKEAKFAAAATAIQAEDPDAYQYLTGNRSDARVGYAMLAGLATMCAVPFLFVAGLLVLGALIIVRFGVMLFPAFATLGLFPTMRSLVTGIGSTIAAALINAMIFGIGASVTVLAMGVILSPSTGIPPWLDIILMALLTIVMWVALRPFRRLTQMVSSQANHFAGASGGVSSAGRSARRTSSRILGSALGTFLGASAARRVLDDDVPEAPDTGVPQRAEAAASYYQPIVAEGETAPAALAGSMQVNAGTVTVLPRPEAGPAVEAPGEIYAPPAARARNSGSRVESGAGAPAPARAAAPAASAVPAVPVGAPAAGAGENANGGRYEFGGGGAAPAAGRRARRPVVADPAEARGSDRGFQPAPGEGGDFDLDELDEVFRPSRGSSDVHENAG